MRYAPQMRNDAESSESERLTTGSSSGFSAVNSLDLIDGYPDFLPQ